LLGIWILNGRYITKDEREAFDKAVINGWEHATKMRKRELEAETQTEEASH
jgi:hypothetical protein